MKDILADKPLLRLFDPKLPVTIQADSSSTGLGACIMQNSQPVAYASRSLTPTEVNYAQIEKELLAILFAAEKFSNYIFGTEVLVQSDHKPLEYIFKKPLHTASPRIQLMLLKLMKHKLKVVYTPGSKMYIADTLSRAYIQGEAELEDHGISEYRVHAVSTHYPATTQKLSQVREATNEDVTLQKLKKYTYGGWPPKRGSVPPNLMPYWIMRDEIHEEDGLLFAGERLIIPSNLRREMLTKIHEGHFGAEKCYLRANESMYWPNIYDDIVDFVAGCAVCATFRKQNQSEPLMPHPVPKRPWSKLGTDIFHFGKHDYLVVVDYLSKYPEVVRLPSKTASAVISALKGIFARHGIPDILFSDNMPFSSEACKQFANDWGFVIETSSPEYPQSNGQSERFVNIVKTLLRKAYEEGRDPHLAILQYRNTPVCGLKHSPAQLLMSRRLNDKLPTAFKLLQPAVVKSATCDLKRRQEKQKLYFDRGTCPLKEHNVGDNVRLRRGKTWVPGVITSKGPAPRSYQVTTTDGGVYRRNRKFINAAPDLITTSPTPSQDASSANVSVKHYSTPPPVTPPSTPQADQGAPPASSPPTAPTPSPRRSIQPVAETQTARSPTTPIPAPRRSTRQRRPPEYLADYV